MYTAANDITPVAAAQKFTTSPQNKVFVIGGFAC